MTLKTAVNDFLEIESMIAEKELEIEVLKIKRTKAKAQLIFLLNEGGIG